MLALSDQTRQRLREKLQALVQRHGEIALLMRDPQVAADRQRLKRLAQEHGSLAPLAERYARLAELARRRQEAEQALKEADEDLRLLAQEELREAARQEEALWEELIDLLTSDQQEAHRNVIMEIRAGTGGEEAALFAADLLRMYTRYAEKKGWRVEIMDTSVTDLGGLREAVLSISGPGAWQRLRYESGGHRVQRVPKTESQGRIHTSLATVAVLPEAEEVEVEIRPEDLDISFMRSSGPGGQKVNKTSSSVRIVHKPTGIAVRCQDEKSQTANRRKAMKLLRAKLYQMQQEQLRQERDALRRTQVGSGDRNERIRTYNFPQDRITDHRIGLDIFGVEKFLMGDCDRMFDALAQYDREQRIKAFADAPAATELR